MRTYKEIKMQEPELFECFFAFSDEQFKEGVEKMGLEGKKIVRAPHDGLFGTREGIAKLLADYDKIDQEIAAECKPQDVYDYEFNNHECEYVGDDSEAFEIVKCLFGERAVEVKRRFVQR